MPPKKIARTYYINAEFFAHFNPVLTSFDPAVIGFASFQTDLLKLCHFWAVGAGISLGYILDYLRYCTPEHDLSKNSYPK